MVMVITYLICMVVNGYYLICMVVNGYPLGLGDCIYYIENFLNFNRIWAMLGFQTQVQFHHNFNKTIIL